MAVGCLQRDCSVTASALVQGDKRDDGEVRRELTREMVCEMQRRRFDRPAIRFALV